MFRLAWLAPLALLLTGCDWFQGEPPARETGGRAEGELLDGSISDEMIPVDQIRSQSPRAAPEPGEDGAAPGASSGAEGDPVSGTPADPTSEPAAEAAEPAAE